MGRATSRRLGVGTSPTVSQRVLRAGARRIVRSDLRLQVEGLEQVPRRGPLLLAARHYHHLHDGAALVATLNRPIHIVVGLDWVQRTPERALMERVCAMAEWPVVLRRDNLTALAGESAFDPAEQRTYQRRALRQALDILRRGDVLVMFPEGYPVIDPHGVSQRRADADLLPFDPGFLRMAALAQRDGVTQVPIVPVGFAADSAAVNRKPYDLTLRFGAPHLLQRSDDLVARAEQIADEVRALSGLAGTPASASPTDDATEMHADDTQHAQPVRNPALAGVDPVEVR